MTGTQLRSAVTEGQGLAPENAQQLPGAENDCGAREARSLCVTFLLNFSHLPPLAPYTPYSL